MVLQHVGWGARAAFGSVFAVSGLLLLTASANATPLQSSLLGCWARQERTVVSVLCFGKQGAMSSTQHLLGARESFEMAARYAINRQTLTLRGQPSEAWVGKAVEVCAANIELQIDHLILSGCAPEGRYKRQCLLPRRDASDILNCPS